MTAKIFFIFCSDCHVTSKVNAVSPSPNVICPGCSSCKGVKKIWSEDIPNKVLMFYDKSKDENES